MSLMPIASPHTIINGVYVEENPNTGIIGYDKSPEVIALGEKMRLESHAKFLEVLEKSKRSYVKENY